MMQLTLFLNAGDPDWQTTADTLLALDQAGVDWVELCVPYANPFTDGAVIRASHQRALLSGMDLAQVLQQLATLRSQLRMKVALMADWSHSVQAIGLSALVEQSKRAGVNALLLHGMPPRQHAAWIAACQAGQLPRVLTLYPDTPLATQDWHNIAFIYLVTRYGRAGTAPVGSQIEAQEGKAQAAAERNEMLTQCVLRIRQHTPAPVFFGFGINTPADAAHAAACGAEGVIIGSHFVDWLHQRTQNNDWSAARVRDYVAQFQVPRHTAMATSTSQEILSC